jgi:adenylosuccinate synthase
MVLSVHKVVDHLSEVELGDAKIGTTKQGIGPCFADKVNRRGIRISDLQNSTPNLKASVRRIFEAHKKRFPNAKELENIDELVERETESLLKFKEFIEPHIVDTVPYLDQLYHQDKSFLLEGANATMLDIDFGTYPFVTSSSTSVSGVFSGLGLSPNKLNCVVGIVKAYTTRVGQGPFPTELEDATGERLRSVGVEVGTTTGRPRRCGWLDLVIVKYTHLINGYNAINLTKLDVLSGLEKLKIATKYSYQGKELPSMPACLDILAKVDVTYVEFDGWSEDISKAKKFEDLPPNCQKYVNFIETSVGVPIRWIGVGAGREDLIDRSV